MASNGGNLNEDEFLDLEPVLDEDSFSFDLDPPELEEIGLDSMVASAGDEYPDDVEITADTNPSLDSTSSSGDMDLNLDLDLDLDIEDEDPLLDEKINEIVEQDNASEAISHDDSDDFVFDDLEVDDEPITLSMDELDNITGEAIQEESSDDTDSITDDSEDTAGEFGSGDLDLDERFLVDDDFFPDEEIIPESTLSPEESSDDTDSSLEESSESTSSFTDEELDDILGTDIFDESEEDLSDEPIALSMDELNNIMSDEDSLPEETVDGLGDLDLDMDTPPDDADLSDELNLDSLEETNSEESLFSDEDIADEPITLSMDELSAITADEDESEETESSSDFVLDTETESSSDFDFSLDLGDSEEMGEEESEETEASDMHSLPEPDDTVDLEEFTLGDEDITSDDKNLLEESDEDTNITLSDEELGNILGAEDELPREGIFSSDDEIAFIPDGEEDKFGTLLDGDDEADDLTSTMEDDSDLDSGVVTDLDEDLADEPITLSTDELNDILGDIPPGEDLEEQSSLVEPEESEEENISDKDEFSMEDETSDSDGFSMDSDEGDSGEMDDFSLGEESVETDDFSLGDESAELDNFSLDDESTEADDFSLEPAEDDVDEFSMEEDSTETISLAEEPIEEVEPQEEENILLDEDILSTDSEQSSLVETEDSPVTPSIDITDTENAVVIDLDEFAEEGGMSPLEELRQSPQETTAPVTELDSTSAEGEKTNESASEEKEELSPEEKKKVLTYLDNLLGNLPDDLIREFSKSNYFDLYKKMMKEIGL